ESQRNETSGLIRVRVAAAVVELDDALQRRKRPVVHVRCVASDFAQTRCLERAAVSRVASDDEPAFVLEPHPFRLPPDSLVPELAVGEVASGVAPRASGAIEKQVEAALGLWRDGVGLVVESPAVIGRITAHPRSLVIGDRRSDPGSRDLVDYERTRMSGNSPYD